MQQKLSGVDADLLSKRYSYVLSRKPLKKMMRRTNAAESRFYPNIWCLCACGYKWKWLPSLKPLHLQKQDFKVDERGTSIQEMIFAIDYQTETVHWIHTGHALAFGKGNQSTTSRPAGKNVEYSLVYIERSLLWKRFCTELLTDYKPFSNLKFDLTGIHSMG